MGEYQAYVIGEDGHIKQRIDLTCADDDAARERAESLVDVHAIELWQLDRKIAKFEPDPLKTDKATGWLNSRTTAAKIAPPQLAACFNRPAPDACGDWSSKIPQT